MATQDNASKILFNATELLDYADLNTMQALHQRHVGELLYRRAIEPGDEAGYDIRTLARALQPTVAGGMKVGLAAGSLLWRDPSDPASPTPRVLSHAYDGEVIIDCNAADAALDRWDIISAKIESGIAGEAELRPYKDAVTGVISTQLLDKRSSTRLTVSYTAGTPDAAPAEPAAPAGEQIIARVVVRAGVTEILETDLRDRRRPAGMVHMRIPAARAFGSDFTINENGVATSTGGASASTNFIVSPQDVLGGLGDSATGPSSGFRFAQLQLHGTLGGNADRSLHRIAEFDGAATAIDGAMGTGTYVISPTGEQSVLWDGGYQYLADGQDANVLFRVKPAAADEIYLVDVRWWGGF